VAKAATKAIPIVFSASGDPVELGLAASLSQPGGNITGVTQLNIELTPKRLELIHELLPKATDIGLLLNPGAVNSKRISHDLQAAAGAFGLTLHVLEASDVHGLAAVFASLPQRKIQALVIGTDAFFNINSAEIAAFAFSQRLPAIYQYRDFTSGGGLLSLGGHLTESYRLVGDYAGRILKGAKPADLPVQQVTKLELILNLKTAKAFGLDIPPTFLARADEVIE
jgi:putative ABC transport system substrate-binding protein